MSCIVKNCGNNVRNSHPRVSFHRFPTKYELARKWLVLLNLRSNYTIRWRKDRICSMHFTTKDFEMQVLHGNKMRKNLRPGAVPFDHRVKRSSGNEEIPTTSTDKFSLGHPAPAPPDIQSIQSPKSLSESVDDQMPAVTLHSVKQETQEAKAVCIVCEDVDNLLDITTDEYSHLHYKLHVVAELQNEFSYWFKFICISCSLALEDAFDFKARCEETHRKLIADLQNEPAMESINNIDSKPHSDENDVEDIVEEKPEIQFEIIEMVKKENDEFTISEDQELVGSSVEVYSEEYGEKSENSINTCSPHDRPKKLHSEEIQSKHFHCEMCTKKFSTKIHLTAHIQDKHVNDVKKEKRRRTSVWNGKFPCGICKRNFSTKEFLTLHTDKYHNDPNAEYGLRFKCNDCGRRFSNNMGYKLHLKTHSKERILSCYICTETFEKQSQLDDHVDMHFGTGHDCKICGNTFQKVSSLRFHMKFHTEKFPFQCPTCLMKFKERDMLLQHTGKCPVVLGLPAPGPSGYSGTAFGS